MRKWLQALLARWFSPPAQLPVTKEVVLTTREKCLQALASLDLPNPINYDVFAADATDIEPLYPKIDVYTRHLNDFDLLVRNDKVVKVLWLQVTPIKTNVDLFFVDSEGFYMDPFTAMVAFHDAARNLCENLVKGEGLEFGVQEHNLRILTNLLNNVIDLVEAFKKVAR